MAVEVTQKYKNKVVYGTTVLVDLTADTVTKDTLKKGATAHDASGEPITGTLTIPDQQTKTVDLNMSSGNQTISPDSGKVLSKVTVTKPTTLIAGNIKKDVNIGGVVGTYEGSGSTGGGSETWVLNDLVSMSQKTREEGLDVQYVDFISNSQNFTQFVMVEEDSVYVLYYGESDEVLPIEVAGGNSYDTVIFSSKIYRKLTFSTAPTGELLTWLEANAVKQASDTAVQESKSVSITENGTTTISPDVPYDAVASVEITTNVASSGGGEAVWYDPV